MNKTAAAINAQRGSFQFLCFSGRWNHQEDAKGVDKILKERNEGHESHIHLNAQLKQTKDCNWLDNLKTKHKQLLSLISI